MADISQVINVALLPEGLLAQRTNMNTVAIMTSDQSVLNSTDRYRSYRSAAAVTADFGATSDVADYANTFFSTTPNAVDFSGSLVIGYWRGKSEVVPATAGTLTGAEFNAVDVIDQLQQITDGQFDIGVDGSLVHVTALDFSAATEMSDVADLLVIAGATVSYLNGRIIITSDTPGAASSVCCVTAATGGAYIGSLLGLVDGSGALTVDGEATDTLTAESMIDALTAVQTKNAFRGVSFIDPMQDGDVPAIAAWAGANNTLVYNVFSGSSYLALGASNPVWAVKLAGQSNFRSLYSAAGNRKLAASYMARAHTVNFNASNSAMTMQLKTLAVPAEPYTTTVINSAKTVGLDLYTTIKDAPVVLTSPANDFVDNVYNLTAFIDAVQIDMFNLLKGTATKIPQTLRGVNQLIDSGEKTTRQFVRAGVFGPGVWSKPDYFGDRETFMRNIRENGYYWIAGELSEQPQADRQARKSPVLQAAVKNAGAIHSADIIINFNI